MKVAIACHGLYPDVAGGMERHTFNLAKHLVQAGVDVDVLVPGPKKKTEYPFSVHHLPWPSRPLWLWSNYDFSRHAGEWIEANQPDLVLSQGFGLWAYLRHRKQPAIFHPHGLDMFGGGQTVWERAKLTPFRRLAKSHVKRSDAVVSMGGKLSDILRVKTGANLKKIVEIPNAVDLKEFLTPSSEKIDRSLLFVGRLAFNKGIDLLVRLVERTRDLPYSLTIVGDGPLRSTVECLAQNDSRVRYLGPVIGGELHDIYASAETLLLTSRAEGMPTVILEAMASGCATVATNVGAVETMVGPESGFVVEPNEQALELTIRKHLGLSSQGRCKMGRVGRSVVESRYTWEQVTPRYTTLFENLLGRGHA